MSSAILEIARQEFVLHRRNRWVITFAILFAALSLAVAYFGMITSGYSGFQDFVRTSASLINLGGFLLPLFALLLGVFSFLTHREYLEVLATQPVTRRAYWNNLSMLACKLTVIIKIRSYIFTT